jgi:hypothetical protein
MSNGVARSDTDIHVTLNDEQGAIVLVQQGNKLWGTRPGDRDNSRAQIFKEDSGHGEPDPSASGLSCDALAISVRAVHFEAPVITTTGF